MKIERIRGIAEELGSNLKKIASKYILKFILAFKCR